MNFMADITIIVGLFNVDFKDDIKTRVALVLILGGLLANSAIAFAAAVQERGNHGR